MSSLSLFKYRVRKFVGLTLVGLICAAILSGIPSSANNPARPSGHHVSREDLPEESLNVAATLYRQTNLVSDIPGFAQVFDPNLVNPWGIALTGTSPFWVSNNVTSTSTLYRGDVGGSAFGINMGLSRVTVPGDLPTGMVANGTNDFVITSGSASGPARFLWASITGNITGWNPNVPAAGSTTAQIGASHSGHVYTGLAIGNNGSANFLYAADFANGRIDVYDKNFALTTLAGNFTDPLLPAGYAPFNIQNLAGKLYVEYAKVDPVTGEDEAGPGNGYISVFDTNGGFLMRLVSNGPLNSPWGVALSPANFGTFSSALLVGNFGDGRINAFNPTTGAFLGTLNDDNGHPIEIEDLWGITFGNGVAGGDTNVLYFAAGIFDETHGLFGKLQEAAPATSSIQFSAAQYGVTETNRIVDITVTRTGDLSQPASVNYAVFDGTASQTSDYIITTGTLNFAASQSSRTFSVLVTDDAYVEPVESVNLVLSNPTGATLGTPSAATLFINENDSPNQLLPAPKVFVATLTGAQEMPPRATNGSGTGLVVLSGNETTALVSLAFTGLTTPANAAHIHGPAPPGMNADILFPLNIPAATSGSVNNVMINLTPAQVQQLKDGLFYFNVHTQQFSSGEIRGQILFNPIDESEYFVRQQYADFLNRYPDQGGLNFWFNEINKCGVNTICISNRRIDVSGAFFIEAEFQQTGFFVYRVRKSTLGVQPSYGQYIVDRNQIGLGTDANKTAFVQAFVQRGDFLQKYPTSQTGAQFIDALIANVQQSSGVDLSSKKPELANEYIQGLTQVESRARVIRKLVEYPEYINAEFNPAFVLAEYFGYLRRDPDPGGFQFWLNVLNNSTPRNFRAMVCAFITSAEYQRRFGPTVTRSNVECGSISPTVASGGDK